MLADAYVDLSGVYPRVSGGASWKQLVVPVNNVKERQAS